MYDYDFICCWYIVLILGIFTSGSDGFASVGCFLIGDVGNWVVVVFDIYFHFSWFCVFL